MSNLLHPGLILIAVGVLAVLVPEMLRKFILAIGPFFALFAALSMPVGTDLSIEFFGTGYHLGYMFVDKLSYVFCMIFALMASIGVFLSYRDQHGSILLHVLCRLGSWCNTG